MAHFTLYAFLSCLQLTHMPAETLRDGIISKSVDVYSFGVLMWQLYTSSRPWAGLRHGQIIVMVVTQVRRPRRCPLHRIRHASI